MPALSAARTHCRQGHPYSEENTYIRPDGGRKCRICKRAWDRQRTARIKETAE